MAGGDAGSSAVDAPSSSYDDTFLTNFRADSDDDGDANDGGEWDERDDEGVENVD